MKNPVMSEAMRSWNARRTPEQKEAFRQKVRDAAVCQLWIPKGPRYGRQPGTKNKRHNVDPNTPIGGTTLAKIERASIKRIIKDLATTQPDLFKDAIIEGLLADPPRSFPYIALAAAYLDGKPIDADPVPQPIADLSELSRDELMRRALRLAGTLREREARGTELAVIDAEVIPEPTLEQLQADVARADEEVRLAEEELRNLTGGK